MKKKNSPSTPRLDQEAVIISHFGVKVLIRFPDGSTHLAHVKRSSGHVVGDCISICEAGQLKRLPRRTLLTRMDNSGKPRPLAANLDSLGIVVTSAPQTPPGFVERILVAAYAAGLKPFIVLNKIDLPATSLLREKLEKEFSTLAQIVCVSASEKQNLEELRQHLATAGRTVLVGVSGAGKSSLLNALVPELDLAVGKLNLDQHGCHVTSVSTLITLPEGGELVDTPGFRDFSPVDVSSEDLAYWYPGFSSILEQSPCRFRNCRHRNEPSCSITAAVGADILKHERYELYLQTLTEIEEREKQQSQRGRS
ncbi:MAG: ribosome small subunit-dependent GTPase A [Desulfuromonadaceae bacterium]|nr:ribosome small subunit-dependent GTPase A [Desulfuromonadaceae bacterium]